MLSPFILFSNNRTKWTRSARLEATPLESKHWQEEISDKITALWVGIEGLASLCQGHRHSFPTIDCVHTLVLGIATEGTSYLPRERACGDC